MFEQENDLYFALLKFFSRLKSEGSFTALPDLHPLQHWLQLDDAQKSIHIQKANEHANSILKQIASATHKDKKRNSLLMQAARSNQKLIVQAVLAAHPNIDLNQHTNAEEERILNVVAFLGYDEILEILLKSPSANIHAKEQDLDALMWAASEGKTTSVGLLLEHGAALNNGDGTSSRKTALYFAAAQGHVETVQLLLAKGARSDIKCDGYSPLDIAKKKKYSQIVSLLESHTHKPTHQEEVMSKELIIKAKALIEFYDTLPEAMRSEGGLYSGIEKLKTWLRLPDTEKSKQVKSMSTCFEMCVTALSESCLVKKDNNGLSALMLAVKQGNIPVVRSLLENKKIPSNEKEKSGATVLHLAASKGNLEMLTVLLTARSDFLVDAKSNEHYTPLMYAASYGHHHCIDILVQHKASVDNASGSVSPLFLAASSGHIETVKTLLGHGASKDKSFNGQTPLSIATQKNHTAVLPLLGGSSSVATTAPVLSQSRTTPPVPSSNPLEEAKTLLHEAGKLKETIKTAQNNYDVYHNQMKQQQTLVETAQEALGKLTKEFEEDKNSLTAQMDTIKQLEKKLVQLKSEQAQHATEHAALEVTLINKKTSTEGLKTQWTKHKSSATSESEKITKMKAILAENAKKREAILAPMRALLLQDEQLNNNNNNDDDDQPLAKKAKITHQ